MNLPVTNRRTALSQAVAINLFVTMTVLIMTFTVNDFHFGHWILLISFIWGIFHYIRSNIQNAILENENIFITVNNKIIKIPIAEISSIESAASMQSILSGTFRTTYFLKTKNQYSFGSTILLGFIREKVFPDEPIEIKTIKSIMEYKKK